MKDDVNYVVDMHDRRKRQRVFHVNMLNQGSAFSTIYRLLHALREFVKKELEEKEEYGVKFKTCTIIIIIFTPFIIFVTLNILSGYVYLCALFIS